MCNAAVIEDQFTFVPDRFKAEEMCDKAVREDPFSLLCVPDWFVTQQQVKIWHHDDDFYDDDDDDEIIEWYDGHEKYKAQKAQIKKELMLIS